MANRKTEKAVPGFRGRSGRTFSAKLKLEQNDEGKWRVEFDEDWAREPANQSGSDSSDGSSAEVGGETSEAVTSA